MGIREHVTIVTKDHSRAAADDSADTIADLDPENFETVVFSLVRKPDQLSAEIERSSHKYYWQNYSLGSLAQAVRDENLDAVIYPDLGMNSRTFALASLRLAPLQCCAWGHPVTTGHENMDVYFSVKGMEPPGAEKHYSEKLLLLPGIGTSYDHPALPEMVSRSSLDLPENRILYFFPQSLFKIHPDNDALLIEILEREPRAVLVMFNSREREINEQFSQRFGKEFAKRGLNPHERLKILPRVSHHDYLRINLACDVMLDSLYWSGGNTALDAIACSLPLVTLPGEFMRGRQSFAMLKALGLNELIAESKEQYVDIALELGRNEDFRKRTRKKMNEKSNSLFSQKAPVHALESFLLSAFDDL